MFKNVGEKVKSFAVAMFVLEIVVAAVVGYSLIAKEDVWTGIIIIFVGFFSSWATSCVIYAIGEAAENSKYTLEALAELRWELSMAAEEEEEEEGEEEVVTDRES